MSDIFDKVVGEQDFIKKLFAKVPGFKGYIERNDRRMSDKLLREQVALAFESQYQRVSALQRDLISHGGLAYIDDLEAAAIKIRQFIDRVRTASYGYAGLFDAVKIKEDDLAQVYQFDLKLLELDDAVSHAMDNVEASIGTDGLPAAIKNLATISQSCVETFNQRSDMLKGIAAS
ncbi:MAG TPA: hypothetical protein PLV20_00455 [Anaerolineaceae bacterium]|jgi:hypothetical protein|nr:hypothetical protein [Anaerolineales bacterium]HOG58269.1 hypothetical protein [Anaerolineaceae bacterium]HOR84461.1 hypothetical protein [Anaerolineaceae bacterium]HPL43046.1 hypothetical protein [Anaerolineaceae bacterium]HPY32947.1 hypothetical protein [Anaerolineaceae bacterium]